MKWTLSFKKYTWIYVMLVLLLAPISHAQINPSPTVLLNSTADGDGTAIDDSPQLVTDGAGTWIAVWSSKYNLGGTAGTDYDIFYSRSLDGGATWSAAALLNSSATIDGSASDEFPQIVTNRAGDWVAVWQSKYNLGDTAGTDADIFVSTSSDNGLTWSDVGLLNSTATSDGTAADELPSLATDDAGNWVVVWQSKYNLGGLVGTDANILMSRSEDNGASWSLVELLNSTGLDDGSGADTHPRLVTDKIGNWVCVWESTFDFDGPGVSGGPDTSDADIFVSSALFDINTGLIWSPASPLNSTASDDDIASDLAPQLATDGAGNWVVVWESLLNLNGTAGTDSDIFVSMSNNAGLSWSNAALLNSSALTDGAAADLAPQISTDNIGQWEVVWESGYNLGSTIGTDLDIFEAYSLDNGLTWSNVVVINSTAESDGTSGDTNPQLANNGAGNWVVVWESVYNLGGTAGTDKDIFVCRHVAPPQPHTADFNADMILSLSELLRMIQFFNLGVFSCLSDSEDGYFPGDNGDTSCLPHNGDFTPQDWSINLTEILRIIQFFNSGGYYYCPGAAQDNFCPNS